MSMMLIDQIKDSACKTAEANAIRAKTGGSAQIAYDWENNKGFADAIDAIPSGGGTPTRTEWYRPPDWPDITSLPFPTIDSGSQAYITVDCSLLDNQGEVSVSYRQGIREMELGHVENGAFVVDADLLSSAPSSGDFLIQIPITGDRFKVLYLSLSTNGYNTRILPRTFTAVEVAEKTVSIASNAASTNYYLCGFYTLQAWTRAANVFAINGLSDRNWAKGLKYVDLYDIDLWNDASRTLYCSFQNMPGLEYVRLPKNGITLMTPSQSATLFVNTFDGCYALREIDLSGIDTQFVTKIDYLFRYCASLRELNLTGWEARLTNCTSIRGAFQQTAVKNLSLQNWNLPVCTNMQDAFINATSETIDLSGWNTAACTTVYQMFYGCANLKSLNLDGWNLSSCTNVTNWFASCGALEDLSLSNSILPSLALPFGPCRSLTDASLVNIANALPTGAAKTLTLHATPKGRLSSIMGTVADGVFTEDASGTVTLMDFITNTKGWTVA